MDDISDFEDQESSWNVFGSIFYVFENYGWHLLILFVIATIIYNKSLKSYLQKYREYKFERDYSAKYHKNPDIFAAHANAQQQWALRMQEKYNKESEESLKKQKEREDKKKQEFMEKYGGSSSSGHVLGNGTTKKDGDDKQNKLRPDYNPLMGAGSSSSYRAPRRSPCGGGGCGR